MQPGFIGVAIQLSVHGRLVEQRPRSVDCDSASCRCLADLSRPASVRSCSSSRGAHRVDESGRQGIPREHRHARRCNTKAYGHHNSPSAAMAGARNADHPRTGSGTSTNPRCVRGAVHSPVWPHSRQLSRRWRCSRHRHRSHVTAGRETIWARPSQAGKRTRICSPKQEPLQGPAKRWPSPPAVPTIPSCRLFRTARKRSEPFGVRSRRA